MQGILSMNYKIKTIPHFDKALKRLARKFPSLKTEYIALLDSLETNPEQGTAIGNNCFKIRVSIASKGKGKSGGARVITHVLVEATNVYLLDIYDKSDKENISDNELAHLIRTIKR
jgi:hypothetical protein